MIQTSPVPSFWRIARLVFVLSTFLVSAACGGGGDSLPTAPTNPPLNIPYSQTDIVVGTGPAAQAGQTLTVHYAGWLYDVNAAQNKGALFDTSIGRGAFKFTLGAGQVIRGWDQGVAGMQMGGMRRLVIPPELAYGTRGQGSIPPNATLVFDVELLAIE